MSQSTVSASLPSSGPVPRWQDWQWFLVVGRILFFIGFLVLMFLLRPGTARLLAASWPGQKLLLQTVLFLMAGTTLELALFWLLNRWKAVAGGLRFALLAAAELVLLGFFFLPAFFAMSVGPAALSILENLSRGQS
jgi:hypothetical protein